MQARTGRKLYILRSALFAHLHTTIHPETPQKVGFSGSSRITRGMVKISDLRASYSVLGGAMRRIARNSSFSPYCEFQDLPCRKVNLASYAVEEAIDDF